MAAFDPDFESFTVSTTAGHPNEARGHAVPSSTAWSPELDLLFNAASNVLLFVCLRFCKIAT
jgi:hypothetical protein